MTDVEAALFAEWTHANLEAYGAALRAAGDPRGELIAIDLAIAQTTSRAARTALEEEKDALHVAWIGELGEGMETKFGFVEALGSEATSEPGIFDAIGGYMREIAIVGDPSEVRTLLAGLVTTPRPWLQMLRIRTFGDEGREVTVDNELAARVIAATPNLAKLVLDGRAVCDELSHPGVTHVVLCGYDAAGVLRGRGAMPHVRTLDFALHPDRYLRREPPPEALRDGLLHRAAFPALELLDVSRNEPGAQAVQPNCFAGKTAFLDVLERMPILPHVRELRVPSLRTQEHTERLQAIVDRMPVLRRLEIARAYPGAARPPRAANAEVVIGFAPNWPALGQLREDDALMFHVGDEWVRAPLEEAYTACEQHYLTMAPAERAAWDALWARVKLLGEDEKRIGVLDLDQVAALASTVDDFGFSELEDKLATHRETTIEIRRIDGYEGTVEDKPPQPRTTASSERIAEHERALQAHWDLDRLAVYADDLQELGDRRGELIAIDLRLARDPDLAYADSPRDALHHEIFGESSRVESQYGFSMIDIGWISDDDELEHVLVGDAARYLREIEIGGTIETVPEALGRLRAEVRPWLRVVRIETMGELAADGVDRPAVAATWPNLEVLELGFDEPNALFTNFVHPRVSELRITRLFALQQLGGPWPACTTLDVAFGAADISRVPTHLITRARFPALHTLDVSRNEPQVGRVERDDRFQGPGGLFDMLARLDVLPQLRHVRVPSPRDAAAVRSLQTALDRMSALETFEVVRRYPQGPHVALAHPRAKLEIPAPVAWPPRDRIEERAAIEILKIVIPLGACARAMERHFADFSEAGQRGWGAIWRALEDPAKAVRAADVYAAMVDLEEVNAFIYEFAAELAAATHSLALDNKLLSFRRTRSDEID